MDVTDTETDLDADLSTPSRELLEALDRLEQEGPQEGQQDERPTFALVIGEFGARITAPVDLVVGRAGDVVVDDPRVSRRHLRLVADPAAGALWAVDAGSGNGSWLVRGDERSELHDRRDLRDGDRVVTIDDVELLRVVEGAP